MKSTISRVVTPLAFLSLMRDGREFKDAKYLISNKGDRHDALIGPASVASLAYQPPRVRAIHRYRYLLATNHVENNPENVLDVAGGLGYGTHILRDQLGEDLNYVSCEIDQRAVEYARKYYPKTSHHQGDAQNLPFNSDRFDLVTSFETMEHIPNVDEYLAELRRVSSDDATLFISVPFEENLNIESQSKYKTYPHLHSFNSEDIDSLIKKHFPLRSVKYFGQHKPRQIISSVDISGLPPGIRKIDPSTGTNTHTLIFRIC